MMLSKLGNMSSAEATEKLTSTLNGYKLEAKDAADVVSKLVAVDNIAATSTNELAVAMQYSAAIANQTGVSLEQLISYIAVVSETTRQNAESIGQGMKTMLSRMMDIKAGKIDEDGLGINNVEIALSKANITLRTSATEFRDFGTVLEELAGKWDGLDGTTQAYISKSIAGIRQTNMFTVLMNNMSSALEFQEEQLNASGLAADRYQTYLESLEAKISQLKEHINAIWQEAIESGYIEKVIDSIQRLLTLIENTGGIKALVRRIITLIGLFKGVPALLGGIKKANEALGIAKTIKQVISFGKETGKAADYLLKVSESMNAAGASEASLNTVMQISNALRQDGWKGLISLASGQATYTTATGAATAATAGFGAALWSALWPVLAIAAAVVGVTLAIKGIKKELDARDISESAKAIKELNEEEQKYREKEKDAQEKLDYYRRLKDSIDKTRTGTEEYTKKKQELKIAQEELIKLFPELRGQIEAEGEITDDTAKKIENLIEQEKILADLRRDSARKKATKAIFGSETPNLGESSGLGVSQTVGGKEYAGTTANQMYGTLASIAGEWNKYKKYSAVGTKDYDSDRAIAAYDLYTEKLKALLTNFEQLDTQTQTFLMGYAGRLQSDSTELKDGLGLILETLASAFDDLHKNSPVDIGDEELIAEIKATTKEVEEEIGDPFAKMYDHVPYTIKKIEELRDAIEKTSKQEFVDPSVESSLNAIGVQLDKENHLLYIGEGEKRKYIDASSDLLAVVMENTTALARATEEEKAHHIEMVNAALAATEKAEAMRELDEEIRKASDTTSIASDALKEYAESGSISEDTAMALASLHGHETFQIQQLGDAYSMSSDAVAKFAVDQLQAAWASAMAQTGAQEGTIEYQYLTQAAIEAGNGNLYLASALITAAKEANNALTDMDNLTTILEKMALLTKVIKEPIGRAGGGSGGGAKQEDPRIKEIENIIKGLDKQIEAHKEEIDLHKKEIDVIKDAQKAYADWINQKKKSLELARKESDYYKEQQERLKSLAKLEKELAVIKLDNSPEARARALELEEQIAEKRKEIEENSEERRHELQIRALDDLKEAFDRASEEQIKGIQTIIDGIQEIIKGIQDQIKSYREEMQELRENSRGSGGSGGPGGTRTGTYSGGSSDTGSGKPIGNQNNMTYVQDEEGNWWLAPVAGETTIIQGPGEGPSHGVGWQAADFSGEGILGADILASRGGRVVNKGDSDVFGYFVDIYDEATKKVVRYSHMMKEFAGDLGTQIRQGEAIGAVGNTGNSDTPHLDWTAFDATVDEFGNVIYDAIHGSVMPVNWGDGIGGIVGDQLSDTLDALRASEEIAIENVGGYIAESTEEINIAQDAVKDGILTLTEVQKLGIKSQSGILSQIVIGIDGLSRAFQYDRKTNKYVEIPIGKVPLPKPRRLVDGPRNPIGGPIMQLYHEGGVVGKPKEYTSGTLNSNEVFAKLLKGEYVATEAQMEKFLTRTLPWLMGGVPKTQSKTITPDISMSMSINVEGNMDKTALKDIELIANRAVEKINRQVASMGHIRASNQFIS